MRCFSHQRSRRTTQLHYLPYLLIDSGQRPHRFVYFLSNDSAKRHILAVGTRGGAYDSQIPTLARFLYNAPATKFHLPVSRSEFIVLINKQTNKQTKDAAENIHLALLCYAGG